MNKSLDIEELEEDGDSLALEFGWIYPESFIGYDKNAIKEHQGRCVISTPEGAIEPEIDPCFYISEYYSECFKAQPDIYKFVEGSLWLTVQLYCSYPTHILTISLRKYFHNDNTDLDNIFTIISSEIDKATKNEDKVAVFLLTDFIFETFEFGPEWGVFVDTSGKSSILQNMITIDEAKKYDILCSKLSAQNIAILAKLENYRFGNTDLNFSKIQD